MAAAPSDDERAREAESLQERVTAWFDVGLSVLALVAVVLLVIELSGVTTGETRERVVQAGLAIWAIFVVAFLIELSMAPSKLHYLRTHWLVVLSLALPFLRVFRAFRALRLLRAARVTRTATLGRVFGALNRARGVLADFANVSQFAYVALLTAIVTLTAAGAAVFFEASATESPIGGFWDALWWAATLVTTTGSSEEVVTAEGRVVSFLLRVYGLSIFGYVTARLAVFFLGRDALAGTEAAGPRSAPEGDDLRALRDEVRALREALTAERTGTGNPPEPRARDTPRHRG